MLAYVLRRYGGPERSSLMEVPEPKPGSRQLLVKVPAAGMNPVDYKTRKGWVRLFQSYCPSYSATNWRAR